MVMRLGLSTAREGQQNEMTGVLGQDEVMLLAGYFRKLPKMYWRDGKRPHY
jgi:hypothetical protein